MLVQSGHGQQGSVCRCCSARLAQGCTSCSGSFQSALLAVLLAPLQLQVLFPPQSLCHYLQAERNLLAVLSADNHDLDLERMGVLTGLAVGLHNLVRGGGDVDRLTGALVAAGQPCVVLACHGLDSNGGHQQMMATSLQLPSY